MAAASRIVRVESFAFSTFFPLRPGSGYSLYREASRLFFAGDRAGDLDRVNPELIYFPDNDSLLFNHVLTKPLRDGSLNMFSLRVHCSTYCACP